MPVILFLIDAFAQMRRLNRASLNMTVSVYLVILYRASFWFARGVEKKSLIKRSAVLQKETTEFR